MIDIEADAHGITSWGLLACRHNAQIIDIDIALSLLAGRILATVIIRPPNLLRRIQGINGICDGSVGGGKSRS